MMNYDQISTIYDNVRQADRDLVRQLISSADISNRSVVLDIGCGTGNYANLLQRISGAHVAGIEPSAGMIAKARLKNPALDLRQADAEHLPFHSNTFDLVYMTDVIHHIPDMNRMFSEFQRVLKPKAVCCIVTQSHVQIDRRPTTTFFPSTAAVDKARYPDIPQIIASAASQALVHRTTVTLHQGDPILLDDTYLELVRAKGYSMLRLITDEEYQIGLQNLEAQYHNGPIRAFQAGDTLVWLQKG